MTEPYNQFKENPPVYGGDYNYQPGYATQPVIQNQPFPGGQTVIIQQTTQRESGRDWSSPMCSCCDDMESCCCVFFFGSCYAQYLMSRYGECCCAVCLIPAPVMALRIQHRNRNKIMGNMLNDCCTSLFCGHCVLCQIKRDMDYVMATKGTLEM